MIKSLIISSTVIILTFVFTFLSSFVCINTLTRLEQTVVAAENARDFETVKEKFVSLERFLSLCIQDSALAEIEVAISEVKSFKENGNEDEAEAGKSRLISLIRGQRRLSGFNIKSIF